MELGGLLVKSYDDIVAKGLGPRTTPGLIYNPVSPSTSSSMSTTYTNTPNQAPLKRLAKKPKKKRAPKPVPAPVARVMSRPQSFANRGYGPRRASPPRGFLLVDSNLDWSLDRGPVTGRDGYPIVLTRAVVNGVKKIYLVEFK